MSPGVNLAAWVDRQLIPGRLWEITWDPEGLLSTLPAIATGMTGLLVGAMLLSGQSDGTQNRMADGQWVCVVVLAGIWSWLFPLNKNLWSSSFVLYTSGWRR